MRCEVVPHHLHNARAAIGSHAAVTSVHGGDRGRAGKCEPQRLDDGSHGAGRAHRVAGARCAGHLGFQSDPFFLVDVAGLVLVPKHPSVRTCTDGTGWLTALQVAVTDHRPGCAKQHRQARANSAHHRAGGGFVTASEQHHAVQRQRAQQLFHFHRKKVAVQHGCGLDHHFAQTHGG